jgi:formate-dependent nitrite reductase membrane component NrfD
MNLLSSRAGTAALCLVMFFLLTAVIIMPPLNMMFVPILFLVDACALGSISTYFREERERAHAPSPARLAALEVALTRSGWVQVDAAGLVLAPPAPEKKLLHAA